MASLVVRNLVVAAGIVGGNYALWWLFVALGATDTPVLICSAVAVVAYLRWGDRVAGGVFVGTVLARWSTRHADLTPCLISGALSTAAAWWAVRRLRAAGEGERLLLTKRGATLYFGYVVVFVASACALGALLGPAHFPSAWSDGWLSFATTWSRNVAGLLLVAPMLWGWTSKVASSEPGELRSFLAVAAALCLSAVGLAWLASRLPWPGDTLAVLLVVPIFWVGLSYPLRETMTLNVLVWTLFVVVGALSRGATETWGLSSNVAVASLAASGCLFMVVPAREERMTQLADLSASREELNLYFESALDMLCIASMDGVFLRLNPEWSRVLGYRVEEMVGRPFMQLVHPEDVDSTLAAVSTLAGQTKVLDFANRYRHRDGTYRWIEWRSYPVRNRIYAVARDITDKRAAELALQESEERFRTLFENMTEGVALHEVLYDDQGNYTNYRVTAVNPAFGGHTGLTAALGVGKLATDLYGTESPPFLKEFCEVAEHRVPRRFETYFVPMEKHFAISVISPKKGEFATVFEDITERKRQEAELRQKNADMERFIYTVSHDLKSPLVTIKAFSSYLKEDISAGASEGIAKDLSYIQNAADKMGTLLDELLEFSRIGRKDAPGVEQSLASVVQAALALVAGRQRESDAEIVVTERAVVLNGEPTRLRQLFQNLLDNALKFTQEGRKPHIEVGAEQVGEEIVLHVRDNGRGIDARHAHKLFGLFEKLDPGGSGTGIGLAVVKRIVEVHGGRVWYESGGLGEGTTFYFTLDKTRFA